jgi:hypothetical protein
MLLGVELRRCSIVEYAFEWRRWVVSNGNDHSAVLG